MPRKTFPAYVPVSLHMHSVIDWILVAIGAAGPFFLGYWQEFYPTLYTYAIVGIGAGLNALTSYPGGLARLLPMRWHQFIEWTSPGPFIILPWLELGNHPATWLLTGIGVAIVLNTALTRKGGAKVEASAGVSGQLNTSSGSSSLP